VVLFPIFKRNGWVAAENALTPNNFIHLSGPQLSHAIFSSDFHIPEFPSWL
jgi:hypothetical protein